MWFWVQLGSVSLWAMVNVLDSALVRHHHSNPIVLMWNQSYFSIIVLAILFGLFQPFTSWMWILMLGGFLAYGGDLLFFVALKRVDTSITNIAWVLMSLFLSVVGFMAFGEHWTMIQTIGCLLIFAGIALISLWGRHIERWSDVGLLGGLALLYLPFYTFQKAALLAGQPVLPVFFWSIASREVFSVLFPLLVPRLRRDVLRAARTARPRFFVANALVILLFFLATLLSTHSYAIGQFSLVSIVANVQPFIVLFFAWLFSHFLPTFDSRELLTGQAVRVKITSFLIVFLGLALLAIHQ